MRKAIFFDIDGTLINSFGGRKDISPRVKKSLRLLQKEGHYIFIATGRPYAFLDEVIRDFGFDGYILANGAHVMVNEKTIHSQSMEEKFVKSFVSMLDKNKIEYVLEDEKNSYLKPSQKNFADFFEKIGILEECFKPEYELDSLQVHKIEVLCPTSKILNDCIEFISEYPQYNYCNSIHPTHLEVYLKENHKASGILKAIDYLDIPIEQTYAFGDGMNDIEMLSTVGCGIAMGNASSEVKKYAKQITEGVDCDGVASGIEKYVLNAI